MIHRSADDRQAERDVHARVEGQHLERNVSLVVVGGSDPCEYSLIPEQDRYTFDEYGRFA